MKPNPERVFMMHGSVKTKLSDFLKYAYAVYGYRLGVKYNNDIYTIYLAHMSSFYDRNNVMMTLQNIVDVGFSIWREVLYSSIKAGYDDEKDMFNGESEYNNKQIWSTPNICTEGNELDLSSPYNASSRYFETELYENYNDYADTDTSDTDVFLIDTVEVGRHSPDGLPMHILNRSIVVTGGVEFKESQWNVRLTPRNMLLSHRLELNSYFAFSEGGELRLDVCEKNSDLTTEAGEESAAIAIGSERLFVPLLASVGGKADIELMESIEASRTGVITFLYNGMMLSGYIADGDSSVTINLLRTTESEINLLMTDKEGI